MPGSTIINITSAGSTNFTVTFTKTFVTVPVIVITPRHNTENVTNIKIRTKTNTGFTGTIYTTNTGSYVVEYIAVGKIQQ